MNTGEIIKESRIKKRLTQEELGKLIGVKKAAVNKWESGIVENLKRSTIEKLSELFNVNPSYLLGIEQERLQNIETVKIPIYEKISCGDGSIVTEEIISYEATPKSWVSEGEYFYIKAKGDSMVGSRIFDGDLLLIEKQSNVEDGDIAAVLIENKAAMKRIFFRNNTIILQSENPNYSPIIVSRDDIRIIGKLKKIIINI